MSRSVAEKANTAVAVMYDDLEALDQPEFSRDEIAVPRIKVAQPLSPAMDKKSSEFIKGLEAGDFFNSVTGQFWKGEADGIYVVVAAYRTTYTEWVPRKKGGGLVADRSEEEGIAEYWRSIFKKDSEGRTRAMTPEGNELIRSAEYYVLIVNLNEGSFQEAVLTFGGTQTKKSRKWNTIITSRRLKRSDGTSFAPLPCAFLYHLTTAGESNDEGNWYGVNPNIANLPGNEQGEVLRLPEGKAIYTAAKTLREMVQSGQKRAAVDVPEEDKSEIPF
jgi:hypothetical protein